MITDAMKPEDEVKVGLTEAPTEVVICELCKRRVIKTLLAAHWENSCPYWPVYPTKE